MTLLSNLVTVEWLNTHKQDKDIIVLDASMHHSVHSDVSASNTVIPDALIFDFENVFVDKHNRLPNMMPQQTEFNRQAQLLGINNDSTIVVYDNKGIFSSARAWYMFHVMGHKNVKILDGGLPAWLAAGFATENWYATPNGHGNFCGELVQTAFCDADFILDNIDNRQVTIIDARSEGRFTGADTEPRAGMRSGHIPNSINLPFTRLLNGNQFCSPETLAQTIQSLGINPDQQLVFSCGSGVTACIPLFVFYNLGYENLSVYDGSWSEWGADEQLPIAIGK